MDETVQLQEASDETTPAARQIHLRVGTQDGKVFVSLTEATNLVVFRPEDALAVANQIRRQANLLQHLQHQAEARIRREKKRKA